MKIKVIFAIPVIKLLNAGHKLKIWYVHLEFFFIEIWLYFGVIFFKKEVVNTFHSLEMNEKTKKKNVCKISLSNYIYWHICDNINKSNWI